MFDYFVGLALKRLMNIEFLTLIQYLSLKVNRLFYVFILRLSLFPYKGVRVRVLSSAFKTDQADFSDWMSFLPSNLMKEVSAKTVALNANT